MFSHFFHIEGVAAAIAILLFAWGLLKGVYHIVKAFDDNLTFVKALKSNHLPHIYHSLNLIAIKLGIEITEPDPPQD